MASHVPACSATAPAAYQGRALGQNSTTTHVSSKARVAAAMRWPAGANASATPGNRGRPLRAAMRNTLRTLSLVTHASPERSSLDSPQNR